MVISKICITIVSYNHNNHINVTNIYNKNQMVIFHSDADQKHNFVQVDASERQMKKITRSQTISENSNGRDSSLEVIENDPRDMYFILKNWNQTWHSHTTGRAVYSSDFGTDGIFCTHEGYEFELKIYPQE